MTSENTDNKKLQPRPPVVAVVGHVDHGKTTLLDFIRKANVAEREAGGITQAVSAYEIEHDGNKITFIDTPGHEAFGAMRERGASIADLAILVVAASEGVKPQTKEAVSILKASKTPFVVAITKIDAPNADIEKTKNELISEGVVLEGAGGDVSWQAISGKTGEGVDDLLGLITLLAEVSNFTFNPSAHANGFILEAEKDPRRGVTAEVVLKNGILKYGNQIVTSSVSGKVKVLENFMGKPTKEILPSAPAIVSGFENLPTVGEEFWAGEADIEVIGVVGGETSEELIKAAEALARVGDTKEAEGKVKAIIKADSAGSLEALKQVLEAFVNIKDSSVGNISEGDIQFAKSTGSMVIGFRVKASKAAEKLADAQKVRILASDIIYKLVEAVESIDTTAEEDKKGGRLEVLVVFSSTSNKNTIGGKVMEGIIRPRMQIRIIRGEEEIGKGRVKSLQQNKEEAKEVAVGNECGMVVETDTKIEKGDILSFS